MTSSSEPTRRVAAIDCGTNSIRLLVVEAGPDGRPVELDRRLELVRLGEGVDATGEFAPQALVRTFAAVDGFVAVLADLGVRQVRFVATSAARDAGNREAFFTGIQQRLGVPAEVIAGDEEATLSFAGALSGVPDGDDPVLVVDIGGGSTELVLGRRDGAVEHAVSLDMGSVRLRERLLHGDPPEVDQVLAARQFVDSLLDGCGIDLSGVGTFIGTAGTATSLSALHQGLVSYDRAAVHRSVLQVADLTRLADELLGSTVAQVEASTCLPRRRAEVICGGALIAERIAARVGRPMVVSESDILDALAAGLLA